MRSDQIFCKHESTTPGIKASLNGFGVLVSAQSRPSGYELPLYGDVKRLEVEVKFIDDFYDPETEEERNLFVYGLTITAEGS